MKSRYFIPLFAAAAVCMGSLGVSVSAAEEQVLYGNGVEARFEESTGKVSLYLCQEDKSAVQMSEPSFISYPVVRGKSVTDFKDFECVIEEDIQGTAGTGNKMTVTSKSSSTGLKRICVLESVEDVEGLFYISTSYQAESAQVNVDKFIDCEFALNDPAQTVWSYNGGGEGEKSIYDTLQKIDLSDNQTFQRENKQDQTSVGIPAADIYSENGGISIGDASVSRRELSTPINEADNTVYAKISRPSQKIGRAQTADAGECFVFVHGGDYYMGLKGYADGMGKLGFETLAPEEIPDSSYDLRWESMGLESDWTIDLIIEKLDELKEMGVKQVTLDDGWYHDAGEWDLNEEKLPDGDADMKRLTDAVHERGMTAVLWWRPCDGGGREGSSLYKEHPEYFVKNQKGSVAKLAGPGELDKFHGTTGYALCPSSEEAVQSQVEFVRKAVETWGFDGLKSDSVWSIPKCYNKAHQHERPEESTENQAVFYREIYLELKKCNPNAFHLLCNCGTPQDYYSLPYVTQIKTADPSSVDQTRRRVKAYKALCGDYFPVSTDHNEIWYPSTIGTGAVLIEKRDMSGDMQAEYERWLEIAQKTELQKGRFIGDLYSYGFDPYETYVVEKDGMMYYGFYRDGTKFSPEQNPDIELKGLDPDKIYRIVDYVNNQVVATNVPGNQAVISKEFSDYLLVYAKELDKPDKEPNPVKETVVEDSDPALVYEGDWTPEQDEAYSGGSCKYTSELSAEVSLTFEGDSVEWYGKKDTDYGSAEVYIDGTLDEEISCMGDTATGVKLYEKTGLLDGEHTIRIVCKEPVIDIDYLIYKQTKSDGEGPLVAVEGVTLSPLELTIRDTSEYKLIAVITPENATNKNVTYTSSRPDVAHVDEKGIVTARKNGTAVITVQTEDGKKTAECKVTVAVPGTDLEDELEKAIAEAEELRKEKEHYTKLSMAVFEMAYEKLVNRSQDASEKEIRQLLENLIDAKNELVTHKEQAVKDLNTVLRIVRGVKNDGNSDGKYTKESWDIFAEAYEKAMESADTADVEELKQRKQNLRAAYDGLQKENLPIQKITLAVPIGLKVSAVSAGAQISFQNVANAAYYEIYRKSGSGEFVKVVATTFTTFLDRSAPKGETSIYTVAAVPASDDTAFTKSAASPGVSVTLPKEKAVVLAAPAGVKAVSKATGVQITFQTVQNAAFYEIYRRIGNGEALKIAEVTTADYLDSSVSAGQSVTYTVVAGAANYANSAESSAVSLTLPKAVSGLKVKAAAGKVRIRFQKVKGANSYLIYRSTSKNGKYKKIKTLKANNTSYTDKKIKKGKTYYYKVVTKKGSAFGVPKKGKKVKIKK